ncbi:hypothetical protein Gpo141_00006941 [Globisporangium polare]
MPIGSTSVSANTLPHLTLTHEDEQELTALADESLRETLSEYENFVYRQKRVVDKHKWKVIKEREDVCAFRERKGDGSGENSPSTEQQQQQRQGQDVEIGPKAAMAANSPQPMLMLTGTIQGTLEDAMYGTYFDDTSSLRSRSTYEKDLMEDMAVLRNIEAPTVDDPFNYLGVSWFLRDFPGLGAVVKRRDFLLLTKSGMAKTSRGEPIGVYLVHSINHRDLPEMDFANIVRGRLAFCLIYRQMTENRVEIFMHSVMDPRGAVMSFFVTQESAQTLLATGKAIHSAQKKKLHYFMRKQAREKSFTGSYVASPLSSSHSHSSNSSSSAGFSRRTAQRQVSSTCTACAKSLDKLFSPSGCFCQICQRMMCSRCSVSKKVIVEATERKVVLKPFIFCLECTLKVNSFPARQVQLEELQMRQLPLR